MNTATIRPTTKVKPTLVGYLIATGIVATLALIPSVLIVLTLWAIGIRANELLVYGICFAVVGGLLWWTRQHLPQGFG